MSQMNQAKSKPYDIAQLGHAVLRKRAVAVNDILGDECQQLIKHMMLAVSEAGGVGIAAPQIHHSVRIFIMCFMPVTIQSAGFQWELKAI